MIGSSCSACLKSLACWPFPLEHISPALSARGEQSCIQISFGGSPNLSKGFLTGLEWLPRFECAAVLFIWTFPSREASSSSTCDSPITRRPRPTSNRAHSPSPSVSVPVKVPSYTCPKSAGGTALLEQRTPTAASLRQPCRLLRPAQKRLRHIPAVPRYHPSIPDFGRWARGGQPAHHFRTDGDQHVTLPQGRLNRTGGCTPPS